MERSERNALLPLALGLDPKDAASFGVPQRALRSISPQLAKAERDKLGRERLLKKVKATLVRPMSSFGVLPGWRREDVGDGDLALPIAEKDLKVVGEKVARIALWCMRSKQFVESTHTVSVHVVERDGVPHIETLVRGGDHLEVAIGARITVRTADDEPGTHLMLFELWNRLYLFCRVLPSGDDSSGSSAAIPQCPMARHSTTGD
jgi:hypothetical protein